MMLFKNITWTVPNILSAYRLLSAPFILTFILLGYETLFVVLFIFNQLTDILDGYLARRWNQQSEAGALLDSYADVGSYLIAFAGMIKFHSYIFNLYGWWLGAFALLYIINMIVPKIKFGRTVAGLHLYSSKITGYVQGIFLVVLFAYGLISSFFYIMIGIGLLAEAEVLIINLLSRRPVVNAKGLYWVIKEGRLHE